MKNILPLMQREWLQHRFAWAMLVLIPLALSVLPLTFGTVDIHREMETKSGAELALLIGFISIVATTVVVGLIFIVSALFITIGLPRRDHADRSVEFWLSLPTGHAESLGTPVLVHMLLAPAAALLAGAVSGLAVSFLLVTRFAGIGEWFALPWGALLAAVLAFVARLAAGLPLALLWLAPLLLLAMLANAYFKRWGLPVLAVAIGVGSQVMSRVFGWDGLMLFVSGLLERSAVSLVGASQQEMVIDSKTAPPEALAHMPGWAWNDFVAALQLLASPLLIGALVLSAALFYALMRWRAGGAGAAG
jgi:ABC-2 type transport system permease protein